MDNTKFITGSVYEIEGIEYLLGRFTSLIEKLKFISLFSLIDGSSYYPPACVKEFHNITEQEFNDACGDQPYKLIKQPTL